MDEASFGQNNLSFSQQAISFTTNAYNYNLDKVLIDMPEPYTFYGDPVTGEVIASIFEDDNGVPGDLRAQLSQDVSPTATIVEITPETTIELAGMTTYWIAFEVNNTGSSMIYWRTTKSANETGSWTLGNAMYERFYPKENNSWELSSASSVLGKISFEATTTEIVELPTPVTPDNFTSSQLSHGDTIDLSWESTSGTEFYKLYRNTSDSFEDAELLVQINDDTTTSYSDTGLERESSFYYWIQAGNRQHTSEVSTYVLGTTRAAVSIQTGNINETPASSVSLLGSRYTVSFTTGHEAAMLDAVRLNLGTPIAIGEETPSGTLQVYIYKDRNGTPDSLFVAQLSTDLPTSAGMVELVADEPVTLDPLSTYWIEPRTISTSEVYWNTTESTEQEGIWQVGDNTLTTDPMLLPGAEEWNPSLNTGVGLFEIDAIGLGWGINLEAMTLEASTNASPSDILLSWDIIDSAHYYRIFRSTDSAFSPSELLAQIDDPSITNYTDTGHIPGSVYYYKIQYFNELGSGTPSNAACGITSNSDNEQVSNLENEFQSNGRIGSSIYEPAYSFTTDSYTYVLNQIRLKAEAAIFPEDLNPGDELNLKVYDDNDGHPGNLIGVVSGTVPTEAGLYSLTPNEGIVLNALSTYWIQGYCESDARPTWQKDYIYQETGNWTIGDRYAKMMPTPEGGESWSLFSGDAIAAFAIDATPYALIDASIPGTPEDLTVVQLPCANQINLNWAPSYFTDFYRIYRSTDPEMNDAQMIAQIDSFDATSYSDKGISDGSTYYYQIRAGNDQNLGEPSATIELISKDQTNLRFNNLWDQESIETGSYSLGFNAKFAMAVTSDNAVYSLTKVYLNMGQTYQSEYLDDSSYLQVSVYTDKGMLPDESNLVGELTGPIPLADSQGIYECTTDDPIILDNLTTYWITVSVHTTVFPRWAYGLDESQGGWTSDGIVRENNDFSPDSWVMTGAPPGGLALEASVDEETAIKLPSTPTNLTASQEEAYNQVHLTWERTERTQSYKIYRSTHKDLSDAVLIAEIDGADSLEYTDTEVFDGGTYYYQVQAAHSKGVGEITEAVTGTTKSYTVVLDNFSQSAESGVFGFSVTGLYNSIVPFHTDNQHYELKRILAPIGDVTAYSEGDLVFEIHEDDDGWPGDLVPNGEFSCEISETGTTYSFTSNGVCHLDNLTRYWIVSRNDTTSLMGWAYTNSEETEGTWSLGSESYHQDQIDGPREYSSSTATNPLIQIRALVDSETELLPPGPQPQLTSTIDYEEVKVVLTWTAADHVASYEIYRSTNSDMEDAQLLETVDAFEELEYEDLSAQRGIRYYYNVRAIQDENSSVWSQTISSYMLQRNDDGDSLPNFLESFAGTDDNQFDDPQNLFSVTQVEGKPAFTFYQSTQDTSGAQIEWSIDLKTWHTTDMDITVLETEGTRELKQAVINSEPAPQHIFFRIHLSDN